jgi:hypothetical protein
VAPADSAIAVWVLYDPPSAKQRGDLKSLQRECASRGWPLREQRAERLRSAAGRPLSILDQRNAHELYRSLHRGRCAFVVFAEIHVRRDPRVRADPGSLIQIQDFMRYKTYAERANATWTADDFAAFCDRVEQWHGESRCESDRDPRCLPFQTFNRGSGSFDLDTAKGRTRFDEEFGPPTRRIDARRLAWNSTKAYHGRDQLAVAGCALRPGFHWDVSGAGRRVRVMNSVEVWEVDGRGYMNVYPDAHLRMGTQARRLAKI